MSCPSCSAPNNGYITFCDSCGAKLPFIKVEPAPRRWPAAAWLTNIAAALFALALLPTLLILRVRPALQLAATQVLPAAMPQTDPFTLTVRSTPPGAGAYLDGVRVGGTPCVISGLDTGRSYEVLVSLEGYQDLRRTISVAPGSERASLVAYLEPEAPASAPRAEEEGLLVVNTLPTVGARVYVDGVDTRRTTPVAAPGIALPAGEHSITFEDKAGRSYTFAVEIEAGETTRKIFKLK
jgi:hypothetical protein